MIQRIDIRRNAACSVPTRESPGWGAQFHANLASFAVLREYRSAALTTEGNKGGFTVDIRFEPFAWDSLGYGVSDDAPAYEMDET